MPLCKSPLVHSRNSQVTETEVLSRRTTWRVFQGPSSSVSGRQQNIPGQHLELRFMEQRKVAPTSTFHTFLWIYQYLVFDELREVAWMDNWSLLLLMWMYASLGSSYKFQINSRFATNFLVLHPGTLPDSYCCYCCYCCYYLLVLYNNYSITAVFNRLVTDQRPVLIPKMSAGLTLADAAAQLYRTF